MWPELVLAAAMVVIFIVVAVVCRIWQAAHERKAARIAADEAIMQRISKELADWQQQVASASHLLTGTDWRDPAGKLEFVKAVYGQVPEYLWYTLGEGMFEEQAWDGVEGIFWGAERSRPQPGDLELHRSGSHEIGLALRVRFPKNFVAEFHLGDKVCPLYQTGYSYFGQPTKGCVNIIELYDAKRAEQPV